MVVLGLCCRKVGRGLELGEDAGFGWGLGGGMTFGGEVL